MLLAGMSARWIGVLVGTGITGLVAAYLFYPVATQRINIWLLGQGDAYQVESARAALTGGGLLGVGPGSGVAKFHLPEAHTDYIFSVSSEEHTSELQSLMRISYAVFCLKTKNDKNAT